MKGKKKWLTAVAALAAAIGATVAGVSPELLLDLVAELVGAG